MKEHHLHLAHGLPLTLRAVTEKLAFVGRTGSGKTYGAGKLTELMLDRGAQVVVLDPVGVWWALRLGTNGKSAGFTIPVFGGLETHRDFPLEPTAGAFMADLIVDRGMSAVLDVSQMIDSDLRRFSVAFATRLFQRRKAAPSAMHLVLDECQDFIPQNPASGGDEPKMLAAFTHIVKLGRNFGIGVSMITQRPQEVNKKCLNLTEVLFAFQLNGTHERKAVAAWAGDKGIDVDIQAILPKLNIGEAHVWSPQWLKVSNKFRILPKTTFDASSTPKVGTKAMRVRPLAPIDIKQIRADMAATVERAKAEDPKALRVELAALKKQLAAKAPKVERVEVPMFGKAEEAQFKRLFVALGGVEGKLGGLQGRLDNVTEEVKKVRRGLETVVGRATDVVREALTPKPRVSRVVVPPFVPRKPAPARTAPTGDDGDLGKGHRAILTAIAQHGDVGVNSKQIITLTGYKRSSCNTYLQRLKSAGYVDQNGKTIIATAEGVAWLGPDFEPLPMGEDLRQHWMTKLPEGERKIFAEVIEAYPGAIERTDLEEATGYKRSSINTYLQKLSSRKLVESPSRGTVRASEDLFS